MSGSELIEQIDNHTGGFWKPSPGSIYPLLSMLQEHGCIKELPPENGLKRYELTQSGRSTLEETKKTRRKFREEASFLPSSFFESTFMKIPPEKACKIRETLKEFAVASFKIGNLMGENYSEQAIDDALNVLQEATKKLEEINKKALGDKVE